MRTTTTGKGLLEEGNTRTSNAIHSGFLRWIRRARIRQWDGRYISWLGEAKSAYGPGHQVFPFRCVMILLLEKGGLARADYLGTLRT